MLKVIRFAAVVFVVSSTIPLAAAGAGPVPNPHSIIGRTKSAAPVYSWRSASPMSTARIFAFAVTLKDGRVLVGGGRGDDVATFDSVEIYDPRTDAWASTGSLVQSRGWGASATLLNDGRVLLAGGQCDPCYYGDTDKAEVYDPDSGTWSSVASLNMDRVGHTATLMKDGRVLIAGGASNFGDPATAEIFDPTSESWTSTGPMVSARGDLAAASLLADGRVLVSGGACMDCADVATASAEIFDPSTNQWTPAAPMNLERFGHVQITLQDGRVLVAGGWNISTGATSTVEFYDPKSASWRYGPRTLVPTLLAKSGLLTSGRVMIAGGTADGALVTEVFDPTTTAWYNAGSVSSNFGADPMGVPLQNDGFLLAGGDGECGTSCISADVEVSHPVLGSSD